jgi:peptide/nickel transport system substrate-binding protein
MKKNSLIIMSLVIMSVLIVTPTKISTETPTGAVETPLIYGTIGLVVDLDPHFAWDRASIDHINQVAEGLFAYDLGSSDGGIIPRLAASCGTWNENHTELTVPLRENVTFHDGTAFNASAVKWNFDRLNAFIEAGETQIAEVYEPLAGVYPATPLVISETVVNSEFEVKFKLNYHFAAFLPLLCFTGSVIMSPASVENSSEFLELGTDLLVGTGPFVHVSTTSEKTVFAAYTNYYRGTPAVQHMEWVEYEDTIATSNALLSGEMDYGDVSTNFLDEFEASDLITVGEIMKSTAFLYIGMNNKLINKTIRQAINYAIDYDEILEDILEGNAVRMISPVPEGIASHDPDVQPAAYNITKARKFLIDAGLSKGLTADSPDQDWINLAETDPIGSYNYTYNPGNIFREEIGQLVKVNSKAIGINVTIINPVWSDWWQNLDPDKLALYITAWGPDYNDPSVFINPLFSNTSEYNYANVNDPWLQTAMMEALEDTNPISRKVKYVAIQEYIVEDLMPWVFLYVPISQNVLANTITNWNCNPMDQLDFFSITFHGEDAIMNDPLMDTNCGFEAPWEYYVPPESTETTTDETLPICIPGYRLMALMGVTTLTIMSMAYKQHKKKIPD